VDTRRVWRISAGATEGPADEEPDGAQRSRYARMRRRSRNLVRNAG